MERNIVQVADIYPSLAEQQNDKESVHFSGMRFAVQNVRIQTENMYLKF